MATMADRLSKPVKKAAEPKDHAGQEQGELIWGIHAVHEFFLNNPRGLAEVLIQRGKNSQKIQEIINLARTNHIRLRFVEPGFMKVPANCRHQGVVARQSSASLLTLDELMEKIASTAGVTPPRLLALDSLQDPHNMGAILRSALAAGFSGVLITRERSVPLSGTVARVSCGAVAQLPVCQVVNLAEALKKIKGLGYWVFGAIADPEARSVYACDFAGPLCLVIGGEGKGIRPLVQKQCDQLMTIPLQSRFDSLNASAAAAVIMFEIVRQQFATA
jgi:23S rRNA (guanosine2251-2'-O)-methyltransferase